MTQTATCGTDNLYACCQAGCTSVTATTSENYGACGYTDTFSCVNGLLTHAATNTCASSGTPSCAAAPGNAYTASVNLSLTCPASSGSTTTALSGSASCDGTGVCSITPVPETQVSGNFTARPHNRFYAVTSYGGPTTRLFTDQASAKVFDQNRLTDVAYTGTCNGGGSCTLVNTTQAAVTFNPATPMVTTTGCADGSTKCTASASDPGWYYEFGDLCPLASCPTNPPWTDEKTGAPGNLVLGCVTWNGFRPYGVSLSTDPCSGSQGAPTVYDYSADYVTGAPSAACNGDQNTNQYFIASQRSVTAAPGGATVRVDVNQNGQINYSVLQLDSGSAPSSESSGTRSTAGAPIYWLEVPRQLHNCRHVDPSSCQ
jgi:type IV pilus assembly protein PilY1